MPTSKPSLSLSFHHFWPEFEAKTSFFVKALSQKYEVTLAKTGRDLQISSVFGTQPPPPDSVGRPLRVWWTGEARDPVGQVFDLYFGHRPKISLLGGRWHRYPLWITNIDWWDATSIYYIGRLLGPRRVTQRSRFCNFIYTQEGSIRAEFFFRLNEARPVESHGKTLNNTGGQPLDKAGKMAVLMRSKAITSPSHRTESFDSLNRPLGLDMSVIKYAWTATVLVERVDYKKC